MASKRRVKKNIRKLHAEIKAIMKKEKMASFIYKGDDDYFADKVSRVFSGLGTVLTDMEAVLDE